MGNMQNDEQNVILVKIFPPSFSEMIEIKLEVWKELLPLNYSILCYSCTLEGVWYKRECDIQVT